MGAVKMRYLMMFVAVLVTVLFCGCQFIDEPIELMQMQRMGTPSNTMATSADDAARTMERRFGGSEAQADKAVESTLIMSEKYKELSLETEKLRQDNSTLKVENDDLARQIAALEAELETTRNELSEANEFLQQMHAELGKWKSDVLGYRDEMRRAQVAELEALKKILKILGAEFVEAPKESQMAREG
jgi:chromosome segregation ATPase